jgi:hypothetical protein
VRQPVVSKHSVVMSTFQPAFWEEATMRAPFSGTSKLEKTQAMPLLRYISPVVRVRVHYLRQQDKAAHVISIAIRTVQFSILGLGTIKSMCFTLTSPFRRDIRMTLLSMAPWIRLLDFTHHRCSHQITHLLQTRQFFTVLSRASWLLGMQIIQSRQPVSCTSLLRLGSMSKATKKLLRYLLTGTDFLNTKPTILK